jgi:hypothetical protein
MTTLYDIEGKINIFGLQMSFMLEEALRRQEQAREEGNQTQIELAQMAVDLVLEQMEAIEE